MEKVDNKELFNKLREEYSQFIFKKYEIIEENEKYIIKYFYSLDDKIELINTIYIRK